MSDQCAVEADIGFLAPCGRRPIIHDGPSRDDFLPLEQHRVTIAARHDGRRAHRLGRDGIEVVRVPDVQMTDPARGDRFAYLRMLERVVGGVTGAARVVALGNGVVRRSERAQRYRRDGTTALGRFAHCDFSRAESGSHFWVRETLSIDEARERIGRRFAMYNVWQCLSDPPQDTPLAFCDPQSIGSNDAIACDQVVRTADGRTVRFEFSLFRHDARQRWFYFPNLRRDELVIFIGYDADVAQPQGIARAAFTDPSCPQDVAPRESIDERLIAFFD